MANYQDSLEGYMRIMKFSPTQDKIFVKTYSPTLDDWQTDADSDFSLDFPLAVTASIRITSPNGGESWKFGSVHNITWDAPGVSNNLKITVLLNGVTVGIIADNVSPGSGSYAWTVGAGMSEFTPGSGYKVKIEEKNTCT